MSSRKYLHGTPGPDRERVRGEDWRASAACLHDPDLWFSNDRTERNLAAEICTTECPVREQCAKAAVSTGATHGVWAGVSLNRNHHAKDELE